MLDKNDSNTSINVLRERTAATEGLKFEKDLLRGTITATAKETA